MSAQIKIERLSQIGTAPCPTAGTGVHSWIFHAASRCRDAGLLPAHAAALIECELTRPAQPSNEVKQAVSAAYNTEPGDRVAGFPPRDMEDIRRLVENGGNCCVDLSEKSPAKKTSQTEVIGSLFKSGELVCFGRTFGKAEVRQATATPAAPLWAQFVVPSPMTARQGITREGKKSARSLSNTGPRRWLVVECDFTNETAVELGAGSTFDVCAAVLLRLAEFRPLVLAVHSGGKSLHGWFPVTPGESETPERSDLWRFMAYAVRLGADKATWCRSQWVRCPGGTRRDLLGRIPKDAARNPVTQEVLYFDPETARRFLP